MSRRNARDCVPMSDWRQAVFVVAALGGSSLVAGQVTIDVPESSEVAVFSQTSLQARVVNPNTPRAIFFNDTTMVAWPAGGFIEIAAQDPRQGVQF